MHPLVALAKRAVEEYVKDRRVITPPEDLSPEMKQRAGVFVSLKKNKQLRGCIGTIVPTTRNVAEEIIKNAIAAATEDPRFYPVQPEELDEIEYSVDVLSEPEKVNDLSELDPKKYGVIVIKDLRKGLLLPNLEGVDTVEEQLRIAKMKAGISPDEDCEIYRFTVKRYN
jgi:AmmeMemoRadiSam system protein A